MEICEPSTSKAAKFNILSNNVGNDNEIDDEDCTFLWSIEDDTLFYAQGLKHHSDGKGKSVYATWNENYLLNFVFKSYGKTDKTSLTKVRISMPVDGQHLEEIADMLILEMNTLLYMKSGHVYYFSSVKSLRKIDWLTGIRCITSCPLTQFSVIRLGNNADDQSRILSLEVYRDVPQLGKCSSNEVLKHTYNITFDSENIFNCDWIDETYTLLSLITDEKNLAYLKQLVSIGDIFRPQNEVINFNINQEVHIFTISANIFILIGAIVSEGDSISNRQVEDFSIRLLNTYSCSVECVRIDCEKNLLIVLLQSGHIDIWYKSNRMLGAIFHYQHEISHFLYYDYWPTKNIFYFTTPEEVVQLKIVTNISIGNEKECMVKEYRKYIVGMIACTFVEELQQLICLSINNIFYKISFTSLPETVDNSNENEAIYENLSILYTLNLKSVNELRAKAQVVDELIQQPKNLHSAIEKEFQKQQVLALVSKSEIFKKLFQCHLEYHVHLPGMEYFDQDCVHIKTSHQSEQFGADTIFCLIFMSLKSHATNFQSSVFAATTWSLHISNQEHSFQLYMPYEILNKKMCIIVNTPMKPDVNASLLPKFSLNLITFFNHRHHPVCLKFNLNLDANSKTYANLFSYCIRNVQIFRNSYDDVTHLLDGKLNYTPRVSNTIKSTENIYKLTQRLKIPTVVLRYVMENIKAKSFSSLDVIFKIYYRHQYLVELNYKDSDEILLISSNYPVAIFYIKLLLLHTMQSCNDVYIMDISLQNMQQIIINYQHVIEHLYGSLEPEDLNSKMIPMRLESLRNIYSKLRDEFYDVII